MTPVPVVSTPLNTRTVREDCSCFAQMRTKECGHTGGRLVADPAFVVLDAAPDLTCRECKGKGRKPGTPLSGFRPQLHCTSCGGSGVSPVYAATWQWRFGAGSGEWHNKTAVNPGGPNTQTRQLVEWRARRVEPLPVVGDDTPWVNSHHVYLTSGGAELCMKTDDGWAGSVLLDITPTVGQFVLRLSDWEHLEQPYTAMPCPMPGVRMGDAGVRLCEVCNGTRRVPLSVPDGVLSWIELTRP